MVPSVDPECTTLLSFTEKLVFISVCILFSLKEEEEKNHGNFLTTKEEQKKT